MESSFGARIGSRGPPAYVRACAPSAILFFFFTLKAQVLRTLKERSIPHIFLTNGGGASEPQCAERFTGLFGENVDPGRLVLGHSAFRELVPLYHDKPVLVIGKYYSFSPPQRQWAHCVCVCYH